MTVIALSYDEPNALAAFADHAGITFPLLSDPNSEVIEGFGIRQGRRKPQETLFEGLLHVRPIPYPPNYE